MIFWAAILATLAATLAALALGARRDRPGSRAGADMALYRDQLREVDRDRERGVLAEDEAGRVRLEVSRRLLAADRAAQGETGAGRGPLAAALLLTGGILAGSVLVYAWLGAPGLPDLPRSERLAAADAARRDRPSQEAMEAALPPWAAPAGTDAGYLDLIGQLRAAVAARPDALQGWQLLARHEAGLGNFAAAWRAQARVIALSPAVTAQDHAEQAALMVQAAGGAVSPEAEASLVRALQLDPSNGTALFYGGLLYLQTGRPDRTFDLWAPLLARSGPDDPWYAPIRERIAAVAAMAGRTRYTPPPALPQAAQGADAAAVAALPAAEREVAIRGMVDGLAARLESEGGPAADWAQLIRALGALGETGRALSFWQEAQSVFAADPAGLGVVRAAAEAAGVAG